MLPLGHVGHICTAAQNNVSSCAWWAAWDRRTWVWWGCSRCCGRQNGKGASRSRSPAVLTCHLPNSFGSPEVRTSVGCYGCALPLEREIRGAFHWEEKYHIANCINAAAAECWRGNETVFVHQGLPGCQYESGSERNHVCWMMLMCSANWGLLVCDKYLM